MTPDPHPSDVLLSQDAADLPPKRKWFGYAAVAASLAISYAVWLGAMGAADEWYDKLALAQPLMPLVMIGGGIGITPFLSLVASDAFARRGGNSTLVYAIPDRSSAVYIEELRTRENALPHLALIVHYSDEPGYVDRAYLESVVEQPFLDCLFLVCGPPPLMAAMRTLLAAAGVSDRQVILEDFEIR